MGKRAIAKAKPAAAKPEIVDEYPDEEVGGYLCVDSDCDRVLLKVPTVFPPNDWLYFSPRQVRQLADNLLKHADLVDERQRVPKLN